MLKDLRHWRTDLPAGLVVFLVALPLCLGIAHSSNAPLLSGIIAGIAGGIVVTLFSNSSLGVSGPAAGLVAIVVVAIDELGFENFLLAVVIAGIIQLILGCVRAGMIGYYFPTAVIKGMLVAIGLIIILKQIPHAVGYDAVDEGVESFQQSDGFNTFTELQHMWEFVAPGAIIITVVCLLLLVLWETKAIKSKKFSTIIQGPLVAVAAGVLMGLAFESIPQLNLREPDALAANEASDDSAEEKETTDGESAADGEAGETTAEKAKHFVSLETTGLMASMQFPKLDMIWNPKLYLTALTLALIASIESLLCCEATDKLDPQRRQTDLNRELRAQGLGNITSGLLGGLPVTQVIVRSSTNIMSGGQTRLSSLAHGILLLICVATIPGILNMIPTASLAAILFIVGFKLAHPSRFKAMYKLGWNQFLPFMITIVAILLTDLLRGVGIGLAASVFFILRNMYFESCWLTKEETEAGPGYRMTLGDRIFFIHKGHIQSTLTEIGAGSSVIIDASKTSFIDQDVLDIFDDFERNAQFQEITVERLGQQLQPSEA